MDIRTATRSEDWMHDCGSIIEQHLRQNPRRFRSLLRIDSEFEPCLNEHQAIRGATPNDAKDCLLASLTYKNLNYRIIQREAGLGSLGPLRPGCNSVHLFEESVPESGQHQARQESSEGGRLSGRLCVLAQAHRQRA